MNRPLSTDELWGIPKTAEQAKAGFKLIDAETGAEVTLPARRTTCLGASITIRDFKPSRFQGNPGYLYTTLNETFVPSVCGLKIVQVWA